MKTFFRHYRFVAGWGCRVVEPRGGVTVYCCTVPEDEHNLRVVWAVARCSRKDPYCKRIGRDIARGRLLAYDNDGEVVLRENLETFLLNKARREFSSNWNLNRLPARLRRRGTAA